MNKTPHGYHSYLIAGFLTAQLSFSAPSFAQAGDGPQEENRKLSETKASAEGKAYSPPRLGAPRTRVGGAVRGSDGPDYAIQVLAPEATGLTSSPSPRLYYFTSTTIAHPIDLVVIRAEAGNDILIETTLAAPTQSSIAVVDLAQLGVSLLPDVDYQWSISVRIDPEQPSRDIVSLGTIRYQPLAATTSNASVSLESLAKSGYWFDLVDRLIESHADQNLLRTILNEQHLESVANQL